MNIIIVGCGKVGYTLVEQLSNEEHNIVVIDKNADKVRHITDNLDAMGIVGNGVSYKTLQRAGVTTADLVIAVTGSDEENLLCCLIAKRTGNCQTIARVRHPIYNEEVEFLKEEFGLAMIINPELTAAGEIAKNFQFPSAIRVDTFARGHVELLHCKITKDSPLVGIKLMQLSQKLKVNVLVCEVIRGDEVIIPTVADKGSEDGIVLTLDHCKEILEQIDGVDFNYMILITMLQRTTTDRLYCERIRETYGNNHVYQSQIRFQAKPVKDAGSQSGILIDNQKANVALDYRELISEVMGEA